MKELQSKKNCEDKINNYDWKNQKKCKHAYDELCILIYFLRKKSVLCMDRKGNNKTMDIEDKYAVIL